MFINFFIELHSQFSLHTRIFSLLIAHLHHWPPRKMEFTCKNSQGDNAQHSENWTYEGKILERKVWFRTSRMAFRKTLLISRSSNDAESSLVVQQTSQDAIPRNFISIWSESKKISEQARAWYLRWDYHLSWLLLMIFQFMISVMVQLPNPSFGI